MMRTRRLGMKAFGSLSYGRWSSRSSGGKLVTVEMFGLSGSGSIYRICFQPNYSNLMGTGTNAGVIP
jgi:hypothetical protein